MTDISPLLGRKPERSPSGLKLMVVDSQPESRALLKGALRTLSAVETIAEMATPVNLELALEENPANIVFIEQSFGWESISGLVGRIRNQQGGAKTNFVLTSSNLTMESRRQGIETGILGYLAKPFDIRSLEMAIRDSMGKVATNHKDTLNKVRRIGFFAEFTDLELVRLLKICHTRKFQVGEYIFHEGDIGDRLYVLLSGTIDILKQRPDGPEKLAQQVAGDCFGEMALVDSEPRSADACVSSDVMVIEVNAEIINDPNDLLALKIFRKLAILVTQKLRNYTR